MYDRRPASRAARGTPTVAVFTPVVRGSFSSAISSPLARAKGPSLSADISWMPGGTSSETGCARPGHCHGRFAVTHSAPRPEEGLALFHRIVRLAALLLALAALG